MALDLFSQASRKISLLVGDTKQRLSSGPSAEYHAVDDTTQTRPSSSLPSRLARHPRLIFTITFSILYALLLLYLSQKHYNDPTSSFFSETHGYAHGYTSLRSAQSETFLAAANSSSTPAPKSGPASKLCLGVATVKRPGEQYIRHTIASLLADLPASDRRKIHLIFFIAHLDPSTHAVYDEPWVHRLPDTLLTYDNTTATTRALIQEWEDKHDYIAKGMFDYAYLLRACAGTSAPYIAMLEGDVLAARGWLPLTLRAAEFVDEMTSAAAAREHPDEKNPEPKWLYLRLFFTETYFGWNAEFWFTYLLSAGVVAVAFASLLVLLRKVVFHSSPAAQGALRTSNILGLTFVFLPLLIGAYFAAGKASVLPLPKGPQRMPDYGCCSQGFVFHRDQVPVVLEEIEAPQRKAPYMDMLMEKVAEARGLEKWAVVPSLLQHVGMKSSKGDETADKNAKKIWNFGFEGLGEDGFGDKGEYAGW